MSHAARRRYLVPLYFFAGGAAGGLYLLAALCQWRGAEGAGPASFGFAAALPLIAACAVILIADLTRPARFWRLLTQFKPTSPVSLGSWILLAFGAAAFLVHPWVGTLLHLPGGGSGSPWPPAWVHLLGVPAALLLISYTGVLLTASSRPEWNGSPWLGALFLTQALATAAALLLVLLAAADPQAPVGEPLARFLAACGAVTLGTLGLHLRRVPRGAGTGGERLARGDLALWFRVAVVLGGLLPQTLWVPGLGATAAAAVAALSLPGGLALRYSVFLCGEPRKSA